MSDQPDWPINFRWKLRLIRWESRLIRRKLKVHSPSVCTTQGPGRNYANERQPISATHNLYGGHLKMRGLWTSDFQCGRCAWFSYPFYSRAEVFRTVGQDETKWHIYHHEASDSTNNAGVCRVQKVKAEVRERSGLTCLPQVFTDLLFLSP